MDRMTQYTEFYVIDRNREGRFHVYNRRTNEELLTDRKIFEAREIEFKDGERWLNARYLSGKIVGDRYTRDVFINISLGKTLEDIEDPSEAFDHCYTHLAETHNVFFEAIGDPEGGMDYYVLDSRAERRMGPYRLYGALGDGYLGLKKNREWVLWKDFEELCEPMPHKKFEWYLRLKRIPGVEDFSHATEDPFEDFSF